MKRERASGSHIHKEEEESTCIIPSLQSLLLQQIISSFETEDSFRFYVSLVRHPRVSELLKKTWEQKKVTGTLVMQKRRFVSAEITIGYLDVKELADHSGIVTQHEKKHTIPIQMDRVTGNLFLDYSQSKLLLKGLLSPIHRNTRFNIF